MGNDEATLAVLYRLKQGARVRLVVDDFGTGYSNLSYLRQLPVDALKIDRFFGWNLEQRHHDAALIAGIVAIARALGLRVTAEGIETQAQYENVRRLGCDFAQGYLIGRPMPAHVLTQRLAEQPAAVLAASAAAASASASAAT